MTPDHQHGSPLRIIHPETGPARSLDHANGHRSERPAKQPAQLRTSWTADELMALTFPPPRWAVPGLVAEGLSLLAGPPKIGKSWLALGLGLAVAGGGKAFDALDVEGGDVLYLALEDTLSFQPAAGAWHLLSGPPDEHTLPETRAAILRWLREHPGNTPKAIADALSLSHDLVKKTCARMAGDGQLLADTAGRYRPTGQHRDSPETVPPVPAVPELPLASRNTEASTDTSPVPAVPVEEEPK